MGRGLAVVDLACRIDVMRCNPPLAKDSGLVASPQVGWDLRTQLRRSNAGSGSRLPTTPRAP